MSFNQSHLKEETDMNELSKRPIFHWQNRTHTFAAIFVKRDDEWNEKLSRNLVHEFVIE